MAFETAANICVARVRLIDHDACVVSPSEASTMPREGLFAGCALDAAHDEMFDQG